MLRNDLSEIMHTVKDLERKNDWLNLENDALKNMLHGSKIKKGSEINLPMQTNQRSKSPFNSFFMKNQSFERVK